MNNKTILTSFLALVFTMFFLAMAFDGGATNESQVYGRAILPYEYLSDVQIVPTCTPKEQVIGRTIFATCEQISDLAEK